MCEAWETRGSSAWRGNRQQVWAATQGWAAAKKLTPRGMREAAPGIVEVWSRCEAVGIGWDTHQGVYGRFGVYGGIIWIRGEGVKDGEILLGGGTPAPLYMCWAASRGSGRQELPMQTSLPVTGEEGAGGARWASRVGRLPAAPSHLPLSASHRSMRLAVSNQHRPRPGLYQARARDGSTRHWSWPARTTCLIHV